jgi:hypothetical protein
MNAIAHCLDVDKQIDILLQRVMFGLDYYENQMHKNTPVVCLIQNILVSEQQLQQQTQGFSQLAKVYKDLTVFISQLLADIKLPTTYQIKANNQKAIFGIDKGLGFEKLSHQDSDILIGHLKWLFREARIIVGNLKKQITQSAPTTTLYREVSKLYMLL